MPQQPDIDAILRKYGPTTPSVSTGADIDAILRKYGPTAPAAPTPSTEYDRLINEAAATHGVDPTFVKAILFQGEKSGEKAVSPKGAVGLAQFMPDTAKQYGVTDPTDPVQAIDGATRYLKDLLTQFK